MSDDDHLRDDPELPGGDEYTGGLDIDDGRPSVDDDDLREALAAVASAMRDHAPVLLVALTDALAQERDLSRQLRERLDQREAEIVDLFDQLDERENDVLDLLARIDWEAAHATRPEIGDTVAADRDGGPAVRKVLDETRDTFNPLRPSTVARPRYVGESADDYSLRDEL